MATKKKRAETYEPKVTTNKTWLELIKQSVNFSPKKKAKTAKKKR